MVKGKLLINIAIYNFFIILFTLLYLFHFYFLLQAPKKYLTNTYDSIFQHVFHSKHKDYISNKRLVLYVCNNFKFFIDHTYLFPYISFSNHIVISKDLENETNVKNNNKKSKQTNIEDRNVEC